MRDVSKGVRKYIKRHVKPVRQVSYLLPADVYDANATDYQLHTIRAKASCDQTRSYCNELAMAMPESCHGDNSLAPIPISISRAISVCAPCQGNRL